MQEGQTGEGGGRTSKNALSTENNEEGTDENRSLGPEQARPRCQAEACGLNFIDQALQASGLRSDSEPQSCFVWQISEVELVANG